MDIQVQIKNVYGQEKLYPVSADAHMICDLAGTKTITESMLRTLLNNGIEVSTSPVSGRISITA